MKSFLLQHLCCPNCDNDIEIENILKVESNDIVNASLICKSCSSTYVVLDGIPILLPKKFSNSEECEFRKKISATNQEMIENWESLYDAHHFRRLAYIRIKECLNSYFLKKPDVLDIGIGCGANYLPYINQINLWGMDFSFESLLFLRKIYKKMGKSIPNLICASLNSIPLKNIEFDIIWSTQVYQHIADINEIEDSFRVIIDKLLKTPGRFIVDNLNYNYARLSPRNIIKSILKTTSMTQENKNAKTFYLKYYLDKDFKLLMEKINTKVKCDIIFTENLFHCEYRLIPKSTVLAKLDNLLSKTPLAKYLGRQISLLVEK